MYPKNFLDESFLYSLHLGCPLICLVEVSICKVAHWTVLLTHCQSKVHLIDSHLLSLVGMLPPHFLIDFYYLQLRRTSLRCYGLEPSDFALRRAVLVASIRLLPQFTSSILRIPSRPRFRRFKPKVASISHETGI